MYDCDCDDETGPCCAHGEVVTIRLGAAARTADELLFVYVNDALSLLGPDALAPWGRETYADVAAAFLAAESGDGGSGRWLADDDLCDDLTSLREQLETELSLAGIETYWEDGYWLVRPTSDCPIYQP